MRTQAAQTINVIQAQPRANGRTPRHQDFAADLNQPLAKHQIFGAIGKDLKTVLGQLCGCFDQTEGIGLQGIGVADDLKLDPFGVEQLTGHLGCGHGLAR